ncbi:cytochrome P450 [Frankia sp. CiP3]|uniref:cytochrome P450 n=1 Tax=Frankia sp. CiP3 TaxID=2880971 RepID=UPI001EF4DE51|nr:cytochrome P450 [Frankia sp. CiP3]
MSGWADPYSPDNLQDTPSGGGDPFGNDLLGVLQDQLTALTETAGSHQQALATMQQTLAGLVEQQRRQQERTDMLETLVRGLQEESGRLSADAPQVR